MLEQLIQLVGNHSQDAVVNNSAIPNQHNNDAIATIAGSILGGLQNNAQGGGLGDVIGLLAGKSGSGSNLMSNPIVAGIAQGAIGSLMEKFGVSNSAAGGIVASVLPNVLGSVIAKTNDPNDTSMDMNGIMGALGSVAQNVNFNQIGAALSDGKLDMNDIMNVLSGSGNNQQQGGAGLLGGLLGSVFGK